MKREVCIMDVKAYMDKGLSLNDILEEVKKEYGKEETKRSAARINKMKREDARAKLMKAWKDYTIVISEMMPENSCAEKDIDKLLGEVEEALRAFETTIDLLEAAGSESKPKEQKDTKKPKAMSDEEILIDFINKIKF